ncbi:MAG: hypothetical protein F7C08_00340 [Desulfurococcales archaeon]|nr:hypothetical protein [Desulfurococcales archaeon]
MYTNQPTDASVVAIASRLTWPSLSLSARLARLATRAMIDSSGSTVA